jgi:hypothetical protein
MSAKNLPPLHELRRKNEKLKQDKAEKNVGLLIGAGLMALGSWSLWEQNLWLAIPFAFILGIDVTKSLKEGFVTRFLTVSYTILLVVGMWFHITSAAWLGAALVAVSLFLARKKMK